MDDPTNPPATPSPTPPAKNNNSPLSSPRASSPHSSPHSYSSSSGTISLTVKAAIGIGAMTGYHLGGVKGTHCLRYILVQPNRNDPNSNNTNLSIYNLFDLPMRNH